MPILSCLKLGRGMADISFQELDKKGGVFKVLEINLNEDLYIWKKSSLLHNVSSITYVHYQVNEEMVSM